MQPHIPVNPGSAVPAAAFCAALHRHENRIILPVFQIIADVRRKIRIAVSALPDLGLVHEHAGVAVDPLKLEHHMSSLIVLWDKKLLEILIFSGVNISGVAAIFSALFLLLVEHRIMRKRNLLCIIRYPEYQLKRIQILPNLPSIIKFYLFHLAPPLFFYGSPFFTF